MRTYDSTHDNVVYEVADVEFMYVAFTQKCLMQVEVK